MKKYRRFMFHDICDVKVWRKSYLWLNFNASTVKSENLQFDVLLLSIANKVSAKKVQKNYLSQHWKMIETLKKKRTFGLINDMKNLVSFNANSGISENLHFDGLILSKVFSVWAKKKYRGVLSWKMTYGFKNDARSLVNFWTSSCK